jgi:hypothetical protein
MYAPLQVPGLAVLHRDSAELKVEEVTHFPQFTPGIDKDPAVAVAGRGS